jgi:hypothetical protein
MNLKAGLTRHGIKVAIGEGFDLNPIQQLTLFQTAVAPLPT